MSDEQEIINVISRYFHLLDDRQPERWGELLTEDVVIHLYDLVITGRDVARRDIFGGQVSGQHGKHVAVNPYIIVLGDRAESVCDYFYVAVMGPKTKANTVRSQSLFSIPLATAISAPSLILRHLEIARKSMRWTVSH